MNKKIVIVGAGGHARVIADIVRASNDIVVGFLDDAYEKGDALYGSQILGHTDNYISYKDECYFVLAIGNNITRQTLAQKMNCSWHTAIHPSAVISPSAQIKEGAVVMPGAVINANAVIGKHAIVNTCAIVEHDSDIGEFSHISPRCTVCGVTRIGKRVWLGAGAVVINVKKICDDVIVGAGAVVTKSIEEEGTYVGVPCKKIK
ncbi:MAG: acetyltransferase [Clostridia bacterium]|nr:acetyltransferase [Clostridia bacterium]